MSAGHADRCADRSAPAPHRKYASVITGFAAFAWSLILPLYAYKVWLKRDYTDFEVYFRSAARARDGLWAQVYSMGDGASPFRYAPLTLLLFRPFAALSYDAARLVWYFLQYAWFLAGFLLLYQVLKRSRSARPAAITALSSLYVLRFCLDCFTIGQVSSLLFVFFAASFAAWSFRRPGRASLFLAGPALFKIGPGILYPLFLKGRPRERVLAVLSPAVLLGAWATGLLAWLALEARMSPYSLRELWRMLWQGWFLAVARDSEYFDAAHYGSQSIKSFCLRLASAGTISMNSANALYLMLALAICVGTLLFWVLRKPKGVRGRAYFFATGIFPYLWVMPETFKYTLTVLAIPVALLLNDAWPEARRDIRHTPQRDRFTLFALGFGALTLSLAGKDLVGDTLFFGLQRASFPLFATLLLGAACFRLAFRASTPSRFGVTARFLLRDLRPEPWPEGAPSPSLRATLIAPIPIFAAREFDHELVGNVLEKAHELLERVDASFEIRLEPYGDRVSLEHPAWIHLSRLAEKRGWFFAQSGTPGGRIQRIRSLALRESFLRSRGARILVLEASQPCEPSFFVQALEAMERPSERNGEDRRKIGLVRGNRRVGASRFRIPVRLLRLVYRRHRLGLLFNRLVRTLLPIETSDTHSGMLVMDRALAAEAFALQGSKDFLFDLELSLVARTHGYDEIDLPVSLHLATEKPQTRMLWETFSILIGLPMLTWRYRSGFYAPARIAMQRFTADDWGISPEVNQGILDLAKRGIVRRVSVMARTRHVSEGLSELLAVPGIELGLHFDLTFERARPREVLFRWLRPGADRERLRGEVANEVESQLRTLRSLGVEPVYVDGHHHIHLVPGIIAAIAPCLRAAGIRRVRLPYDPSLWTTPLAALNVLSILARSSLERHGFESLPCFYPRPSHFRDPGRFRASLAKNPNAEVIVHPARANDFERCGVADPYAEGRVREYRALCMLSALPPGSEKMILAKDEVSL